MNVAATVHRHWQDLPFAQKLAGLLIALVSLPIIIVVVYTTYSSRDALIASTRARNLERALGTAQIIDAFFADARADVRVVSSLPAIVEFCENSSAPGRHDRAMRSLSAMRNEQQLLALYVTDRSGRVLATTDDRVAIGSQQTGRVFLTAIAGDTVVDDPDYDAFDQRVALRVSHAVRSDAGGIIGTVTALIDVTVLDSLTSSDADYAGYGEFGVLSTAPGVHLSHSSDPTVRFASWVPLPPDTAAITRQRLGPAYLGEHAVDPGFAAVADRAAWLLYDTGTDPHLRVASERLGTLHATIVPLAGMRWVYGIFVPEWRLLGALRGQLLHEWVAAFFTVLSALALSVIAARWVTKPLHRVTSVANALAAGDMTRRVHLEQEDELGQLGAAFDAMATALADKERQVQAHAALLERRVEERTATLQLFERASRTLASSLELRRTALNLAALLVPSIADFCSIDIRDLHGNFRRVACRHADAAREQAANEVTDVRAVRDPAWTLSAEERQALGLEDVRVYELSAGRQVVGMLSVGMADSGRLFTEDAERVFEELGRRAGLALANALLYQEAQDANRLKDEFLSVVSHELRTPLNAIMGWTRLAGISREAGIEAHEALDAVDRNARALARLVDDLLDVPRIMMGKLTLDLRPVDLVTVVGGAVDAVRPTAEAKALTLSMQSELPSASLEGDPHRLQQVFWNLLANAVKFTPAGGRIAVRVFRAADNFVTTVEDTGVGIPKDFLPFVFDRFRQADSSTTRAHGGLGIGLSIVRNLIEMHGGRVRALSEGNGTGSTFTVELPVTYADPITAADAFARVSDDAEIERVRGMRLLVLDDESDSREVLLRLLRSGGAVVTPATSVAEAVEALRQSPSDFDAVLADIGMPVEDGYAFIAGLRSSADVRLRGLPVVAVTAYASRADRNRALAAGFDGHVAKPVTLGALADALERALARR
ncbi:MAG TPA: ATP-binding protein [Vicinamibacterales bacterium]|nr:ATP-binding protein [Vicinamibacterales bacterium]